MNFEDQEFPVTLPPQGLMGVDWGWKKVGLATADSFGISATPQKVFLREPMPKEDAWKLKSSDLKTLKSFREEFDPGLCIMGVPVHAHGGAVDHENEIILLGQELQVKLEIPVLFVSEALTSWEASKKGSSKNDDAIAAAVILRDFYALWERKMRGKLS